MSNQKHSPADPHREYVDPAKPVDPPRANVGDIELLSQTIAIRIWAFRSNHSLATVLSDGFFDGLRDVTLKKNDRIEVVASADQPFSDHATLVIDRVDNGIATPTLMHLYRRDQ